MALDKKVRAESDPPASEPDRTNPIVRFVETITPEEDEVLTRMACLDGLHGDEPTPER